MKSTIFLSMALASSSLLVAETSPVLYFQEQNPSTQKVEKSSTIADGPSSSNGDYSSDSPSTCTCQFYYKFPDETHNWYIGLDYLYWTVYEPATYYATTKSYPLPGEAAYNQSQSVQYQEIGTVQEANFGWGSGGRGTLGYHFGSSPWTLLSDYTYFRTSKKQTVYRPDTIYGIINGLATTQITGIPTTQANTNAEFQYQTTRILLETSWSPTQMVKTTFGFGPKASWYNQYWTVRFLPLTASTGVMNAATGVTSLNQFKNKGWGVGLNVASDVDFNLGYGLSLGVGGSVSPLVGQTTFTDTGTMAGVGNLSVGGPGLRFLLERGYKYQFIWEAQLATNLAWSYSTSSFATRISLGYEFNCVANINHQYRPGGVQGFSDSGKFPSYNNANIYMHGLVANLGFGF